MQNKRRKGRIRILHPATGREVSVPADFVLRSCGDAFPLNLMLRDIRAIPGQLVQDMSDNFDTYPAGRILLMIVLSMVVAHHVVLASVHLFTRGDTDYVMLAMMQPANLLCSTFVWQFYSWTNLTVQSKR